jgi:probable F420-dependent oxidoreductase
MLDPADPTTPADPRRRLGRLGLWGQLASLPAAALRPYVARAAELGYGALWVGDGTARDPFAQLAAVAQASGSMTLGTSIVNIFGRDAMAARMGAMTLHELTGGRFLLGLGVSHVHLVQGIRGHRYERPYTRMREYLEAYRQSPYRGPLLEDAQGAPTEPPLLIAALGPRMLELAATQTDGTLPYLVTAERIAQMRELLDAAVPSGRPRPLIATSLATVVETDPTTARSIGRAWLQPYGRAQNYQRSLALQGFGPEEREPPFADRLVDAVVAWGDADRVRARIAEYHAAGADHVALIPLGPGGTAEHRPTLEALAPA